MAMRRFFRTFRSLTVLTVFVTAAFAQPVAGDILGVGFDTSRFASMTPVVAAGVETVYNTTPLGGFGGTGGATSQSVLWNPVFPASAFVGGFGFLGQADFGGGGTVTAWTPFVLPAGATPAQLSVDAAGRILVADAGTDSVYWVDPTAAGAITMVAAAGPWGTNLNAGAVDPITGDIYVGGSGSIWILPCGTGAPLVYATGWSGATSFVSGIVPHPILGGIVATLLSVNRVVHIDGAGVFTDLAPAGSIASPNAVTLDAALDLVVGGSGRQIYHVPGGGGAPMLIGTLSITGTSAAGVAIFGVLPTAPRNYQTNCPEAVFTANMTFGSGVVPAALTAPLGASVAVQIDSTLLGNAWDLAATLVPLVPLSGGGLALPNGDIVNIDILSPSFTLLFGGFGGPGFAPATLAVTSTAPLLLSGQMPILDPATPGGIRLSAPAQISFM